MNTSELVTNLKTLGLTVVYCVPGELIISDDYSETDLKLMLDRLKLPTCPFSNSILLETIVEELLEKMQKKDSSLSLEMTMNNVKQDKTLPQGFLYIDSNFERVGVDKEEFSALYQQHKKLVAENYALHTEYNLVKDDKNCAEERIILERELESMSEEMEVLRQRLRVMTSKLYQ